MNSLGLLSGYNSSSDEDEGVNRTTDPPQSKVNFFAEDAPSSEDEAEHHDKKEAAVEPSTPPASSLPPSRLPAPQLGVRSGVSGSSGVFSNPFQDQQQAQLSVLERHVKLSDGNWGKGKKGVCLAYQRDGRCRYGTNCKYSHGSDLPPGATQRESQGKELNNEARDLHREGWKQEEVEVTEEPGERQTERKRKKPGLSNTLIPPKKSLKNYQKQLSAERPWSL